MGEAEWGEGTQTSGGTNDRDPLHYRTNRDCSARHVQVLRHPIFHPSSLDNTHTQISLFPSTFHLLFRRGSLEAA